MKLVNLAATAAALTTFAFGTTVFAATDTDTFTVSASVSDTCTIEAGDLAFGTYDTVTGDAVASTSTLTVACTKGATATITVDEGSDPTTASTAASPERRMVSGTNKLDYLLYQDDQHSAVWGDTEETGQEYTASSSSSTDLTVYGNIPADQDVPAGEYSDTVTATITF